MSDTPETDYTPKLYFGDNRPSMETECVASDFARNLERQRNMLLVVLEGIMEWWDKVDRGADQMEDSEVDAIASKAREAIASVKQNSPYAGKES